MENSSDCRREIPADLVSEILGRLQVTDCIRSGAVCHSWASELGAKQFRPNPNQTPWLMLPGQPEDEETTATFMDLSNNNKLYKIRLPDNPPIRSRYCMGSSDGWLVTVDSRAEMILLNPLTGSQIELPSITTLTSILSPNCDSEGNITTFCFKCKFWNPGPREPEEFRSFFYIKVVLSSSPIEKDYMIMLIHNPGERLAFARAGDKAWTLCPSSQEFYLFNDVIYLEGRFYTLRANGLVQAWDPQNTEGIFSMPTLSIPFFEDADQSYNKYLVMSPWGSLLQVWRLLNGVNRSEEFKVYQLGKTSQKWIEIKNLGDHTLFIGYNRSVCVSSRDVPGVRRNCIYFTQDSMLETMFEPENWIQTRDVGIYNLEDGSFELFFPSDSAQLNWPPPIWITPNLF